MSRKIIKIISLALIAVTLDALLVFLHFASAGDNKPKGCGNHADIYFYRPTRLNGIITVI